MENCQHTYTRNNSASWLCRLKLPINLLPLNTAAAELWTTVRVCSLTLSERLPVVEATHELLGVKGRTLLCSGVQRSSSSAHLEDKNNNSQGETS